MKWFDDLEFLKKKPFLQHIKQWAMYSGCSDCSGTAQRLVTTYLSSKNFDLPYTIGEVKIFRRQKGRDEPLWVQGSRMRHFILINLFLFTIYIRLLFSMVDKVNIKVGPYYWICPWILKFFCLNNWIDHIRA